MLYTALDPETVNQELLRSARRAGLDAATLAPRRLATIHARLSRVLDLTSPSVRAALGVTEADLTADDPATARAIGEAANHLGYEAILAPSAAGAGTVLAILIDNRAADSVLEFVDVRDGYRWSADS